MTDDLRADVLAGIDRTIRMVDAIPILSASEHAEVTSADLYACFSGTEEQTVADFCADARNGWLDALRLLREDTEKHLESENTWGCLHCHELWPCQAIRERAQVYAPDALKEKA